MAENIRERSQMDPAYTWQITDLYPDDNAWQADYERLQGVLQQLAGYAGHLNDSAATLLAFLQLQDQMAEQGDRLISYAYRKTDEDTRQAAYQEMSTRADNFIVAWGQALAFETPELLAIPEERLASFYKEEPRLEHYRLAMDRIRSKKDHTLSAAEEKLLAAAGSMGQAPGNIFALMNNADLTFADAMDSQGNAHPLTHGSYGSLMESTDRTLRESTFHSLYAGYGKLKNTCAAVLGAQMKQLQFFAEARKYPSALHAALAETEVPVEIYHNLIETVHQHLPAMHRYVKLRKRLLGVDELHYYDMYAPVVADEQMTIPFAEGKEMALEALAPLGAEYRSILEEGFANRWIDVYENTGKRSGAYSAGVYGVHPFVLLNYTDTLNDVFTLVHEMGHALHSYLSNREQSVTYSDYKIFVAEVASTCNEALLIQHLLGKTQEPKRRAYLINHFLERFRATLYRQTMFAEFELWCSEQTRPYRRFPLRKVRRTQPAVLRRRDRGRPRDRAGVGPHPAFLLQLLRLSVCHRLCQCGGAVPAHPAGGRTRRGGLPALPQRRLLRRPRHPAQRRRRGPVHPRAGGKRAGIFQHPAGRDGGPAGPVSRSPAQSPRTKLFRREKALFIALFFGKNHESFTFRTLFRHFWLLFLCGFAKI